ncbi:DUF1570 domain-containing protein [Sphingobium nicotianae]|uniref:DUF1570 domain-containing protein n=1 Tax=Sphingobium nicotianae TaxID=2782607 RepID=A0A9X1IQ75_9SPHN|nr:DUF1570 domain-containing protein [Sphingobium nicotianae]MBT2186568.1 DUF1570 domain-containing protein [Sphingobium nicotianae]
MKLFLLAALLWATPAALSAKWLEASSSHFIVYADESPVEIQQFSEQLERFHEGVAFLLDISQAKPSPSNRVTVFVVRNEAAVRKLAGDGPRYLYAFYQPGAGSSIAIVPAIDAHGGTLDFSMVALLHEYTHHIQISASDFAWPRWFVEGSAEFFASAKFQRDGTLMLGLPAQHRAAELYLAPDVTATNLLDPSSYHNVDGKRQDAYYGRAWLLYHYLTFGPTRRGQLAAYLGLLRQGKSLSDAAKSVFGDLDKLDHDMDKYLGKRMLTAIRLGPERLKPGPVTIRELSPGEAAIMPIRIRSRRGVDAAQAAELLPEAQTVATRFPKDAAVQAALAEASFDAGHDDEAIIAADAALALDPSQVNAYIQKGFALFDKAGKADNKAEAFRNARQPFIALNKIENDHPLPLLYFYLSFIKQGIEPSANARSALQRASELAPFDQEVRFLLAQQDIHDKKFAEAIRNLEPLAYDPHGGSGPDAARRMLEALKAGDHLDGPGGALVIAPPPGELSPGQKDDPAPKKN